MKKTESKYEYIRSLYAKLTCESEIARELGISRQALLDYRLRHKIPYNKIVYKKKTYLRRWGERNNCIVKDYLEGKPISALTKKYKVGSPDINYILTKYNVKRKFIYPNASRNMDILEQRNKGVPVKDLAEMYGMSRYYVSTMLYKLKKKIKKGKKHE